MSIGLLALLDDVAALIKVTAATLDDIPAQVAKTTGKVSGIVIDDAAVTPKYVVGLDPSRELIIISRIAKKSLIHKLLVLGPAALVLGYFAPWAIQPLLMIGGGYLCFEGYEKVHSMFSTHKEVDEEADAITPEQLETMRTKSAVQTDFILSAEITAVTFASVAHEDLVTQVAVLGSVAIAITIAVYGFVGLIVKADDFGVYLYKTGKRAFVRNLGKSIVKAMPGFLRILGYIGTAAMLWVGAEIIAHGIAPAHHALQSLEASIPMPFMAWLVKASVCAVSGVVLGVVIEKAVHLVKTQAKR